MKFSVNQKDLQSSLNYCQGVIEKKSTLPILSNVLLEAKDSNLKITATDLDLIFIQNISNIEISLEGETTTSCSTLYDIVRKFNNEKKIDFNLLSENKINLEVFIFEFRVYVKDNSHVCASSRALGCLR